MTKTKTTNGSSTHFDKPNDHKQIAREFLEQVVAVNIDDAYSKYVSSKGKHHNPFFREGFPALQVAMKEDHHQFPNKQFTIKTVIGEGDLVAVHSHLVIRPNEPGMTVVHLFRFQGEKIVELWDVGQAIPADSPNHDGAF
jgi:predicted SnoaL-like aldol condensation-catalyzing enzyme